MTEPFLPPILLALWTRALQIIPYLQDHLGRVDLAEAVDLAEVVEAVEVVEVDSNFACIFFWLSYHYLITNN